MTVTDHGARDPLAAELHRTLDAVYQHSSRPAGPPPWETVQRGMARVRARRRIRRAATSTAGVLSVVALAAGIQLNAVPYPRWAPAIPAGLGEVPTFGDTPTRGSLAADTAWLRSLQQLVAEPKVESGGERWTVSGPDDVHVVYAGDVGSYRLALVEDVRRWGLLESPSSSWLVGRRGDAPADLMENGGTPLQGETDGVGEGPISIGTVSPGMFQAGQTAGGRQDVRSQLGGAVMVALGLPEVEVFSAPTFDPDGTEHRVRKTVKADRDRVITLTAPAGRGSVEVEARGVPELGLFTPVQPNGRALLEPDPEVDAAGVPAALLAAPVHGPAAPPTSAQREFLAQAVNLLRQEGGGALAGQTWRTLWLAADPGKTGARVGPASVVALTLPGGSHLIYAARYEEWAGVTVTRPAGSLEKVGLALRWPTEKQLVAGDSAQAEQLALLGPVGAAQARVSGTADGSGSGVTLVGLDDGFAMLDADAAGEVDFLDAAGRVLTRTEVTAWPY